MPTERVDAGAQLLSIARAAIAQALGSELSACAEDEDARWLQEWGACFVTLTQQDRLRGCVGTVQARRALLADLKANAVAAALHDPRFAPLTLAELARTRIEVSLLSPMQALQFDSEAQALAQLQPGTDGVFLEFGPFRSTFLPQVWAQLPSAPEFLAQLKRKAGLAADFWSPELRLQRYSVRHWKERDVSAHADSALAFSATGRS